MHLTLLLNPWSLVLLLNHLPFFCLTCFWKMDGIRASPGEAFLPILLALLRECWRKAGCSMPPPFLLGFSGRSSGSTMAIPQAVLQGSHSGHYFWLVCTIVTWKKGSHTLQWLSLHVLLKMQAVANHRSIPGGLRPCGLQLTLLSIWACL